MKVLADFQICISVPLREKMETRKQIFGNKTRRIFVGNLRFFLNVNQVEFHTSLNLLKVDKYFVTH